MCVVSSQFLHKHPGHRLGCNPKTGAEDIKGHLFFKPIEWDKLERRELKPPFKPKIVSDTMNWHLSEHFVSMARERDYSDHCKCLWLSRSSSFPFQYSTSSMSTSMIECNELLRKASVVYSV